MALLKTLFAMIAICVTVVSAFPGDFLPNAGSKCVSVKNQNYCNPKCNNCKNGVAIRKSKDLLNIGGVDVTKLTDEIKKQCYQANSKDYVCPSTSSSVSTKYSEGTGYTGGSVSVAFSGTLKVKDFDNAVSLLSHAIQTDSKPKYECLCYDGNCPPKSDCFKEHKISDSYAITMPDADPSNPFQISFEAHTMSGSACKDLTTAGSAIAGVFDESGVAGGVFSLLSLACN